MLVNISIVFPRTTILNQNSFLLELDLPPNPSPRSARWARWVRITQHPPTSLTVIDSDQG